RARGLVGADPTGPTTPSFHAGKNAETRFRAGDTAERKLSGEVDATRSGLDTTKLVAPDDGRKVIRTGQITLVVPTYDDARTKIDALVKQLGGYVDSTNVNHRAGEVSDATIVVRIPAHRIGSIL